MTDYANMTEGQRMRYDTYHSQHSHQSSEPQTYNPFSTVHTHTPLGTPAGGHQQKIGQLGPKSNSRSLFQRVVPYVGGLAALGLAGALGEYVGNARLISKKERDHALDLDLGFSAFPESYLEYEQKQIKPKGSIDLHATYAGFEKRMGLLSKSGSPDIYDKKWTSKTVPSQYRQTNAPTDREYERSVAHHFTGGLRSVHKGSLYDRPQTPSIFSSYRYPKTGTGYHEI